MLIELVMISNKNIMSSLRTCLHTFRKIFGCYKNYFFTPGNQLIGVVLHCRGLEVLNLWINDIVYK